MKFGFKDEHFDLEYDNYKNINSDINYLLEDEEKFNKGIIK